MSFATGTRSRTATKKSFDLLGCEQTRCAAAEENGYDFAPADQRQISIQIADQPIHIPSCGSESGATCELKSQ